MDTKFSSAIHTLILISESEMPMNSEQIATSVGTNAYDSVMETENLHIFDIHQNPNDECIVGHNIRPVLNGMFRNMEERVEKELSSITLKDAINNMRQYINENEKKEKKQ
ncbi:Rrf2 family transcriptional regulator [Sharpea azabuensis]|uniref:Rrf2 family transcriptional regulator n=1 Tax=Sharpea azabuensis TaxID=322505 RepID=UPI0015694AF9|nr:Rrf2 family transcriptional regulator [Sharpea azabuensis]